MIAVDCIAMFIPVLSSPSPVHQATVAVRILHNRKTTRSQLTFGTCFFFVRNHISRNLRVCITDVLPTHFVLPPYKLVSWRVPG